MKLSYTTVNGRTKFELEVATGKQAFEALANMQELFEEPMCCCCKSTNIKCQVQRTKDDDTYFKYACNACGAQLDIGQRKDGKGMWIKRVDKDEQGVYVDIGVNGWYKYKDRQKAPPRDEHDQTREPVKPRETLPYQGSHDIPFLWLLAVLMPFSWLLT